MTPKHQLLVRIIGGLLAMTLLTMTLLVATALAASRAGQTSPATLELWLWLLIGGSGMFGGFLYGLKDRSLVLPHRTSRFEIEPGFVADCLFGLAGGFLIFILLPGNFDFDAGIWELTKIVAVAVVGGYGGRALVSKVLSQQFQELEQDIQSLRSQNKQGGTALALLSQHFDDDLDTPPVDEAELKEAILAAPASIKTVAFNMAHDFRNNTYEEHPERIDRAIPVLEALIEDDVTNRYHRNHAELAYVLKDKISPEWKRAEEALTKAIEIRDRRNHSGFRLYEFNRAICRIHLQAPLPLIKSDLDEALPWPRTGDLIRHPHPIKARALIEWLKQNRDQLAGWMKDNGINLPA